MKKLIVCLAMFFCFAVPVHADIHAYSKGDQYLGIASSPLYNDEGYIYIPSIGMFAPLITNNSGASFKIEEFKHNVYYESSDCTGPRYSTEERNEYILYGCDGFVFKQGTAKQEITVNSSRNGCSAGCSQIGPEVKNLIPFETVESLPFTLPIQGPLKFRYSKDDISGDGKKGLEEAIDALQTVAGVK